MPESNSTARRKEELGSAILGRIGECQDRGRWQTSWHTDQLDAADLAAAHELLVVAFAADLTHRNWKHSLGGLHALVWDGPELVGHASLVPRRLLHAGRVLPTGYVGGVGVQSDSRRRGHGPAMMAALEELARDA